MEKAEEANEEEKATKEAGKRDGSFKAKTCKGCMYYSSLLKSQSRDPVCFGLSRFIQNVPAGDILKARERKMEASKENSEGEFKYVCVGYSIKLDRENSSVGPQEKEVELPFCVGVKFLQFLVDKRTSTADSDSLHDRRAKDGSIVHPPQPNKPATAIGEDFLSRFERNATIVAGGVARNMLKVGSYIKANLEDMLHPYRRPPK